MAVLFMDSCDHYTQADATKKYHLVPQATVNSTLSYTNLGASTWPAGGGVQVWTNVLSTGCAHQWNGSTNEATVIVGGWFYFTGIPTGVSNWMFGGYDAGTNQWFVQRDTNNRLTLTRNNTATTLATSNNTFNLNTWYFIEAKIKTDGSVGTYEVRVNGSSTNWIPAASGANTRATANNYTNQYSFAAAVNNGSTLSFRGLYVLNTSGSVAADFLGMNMIRCLRPAGIGNYAQWTSNVGINYIAVDDILGDGDGSFNQSSVVNNIDSFLFQDLPGSGSVFAIQHVLMVRQDGGAGRTIAAIQRSANTDYVGANQPQAGTYLYYMDPQTTSPATSAQFTANEVNAAEFGYKVIA